MIIENHPDDYNGFPFITLIQFEEEHVLTIVDNYDKRTIKAYVLDYCKLSNVDEFNLVSVANNWWNNNKPPYPISIEFSRRNMTIETSKIYRSFVVESVVRVIGPLFSFDMDNVSRIRKKRRISPNNIISVRNIL